VTSVSHRYQPLGAGLAVLAAPDLYGTVCIPGGVQLLSSGTGVLDQEFRWLPLDSAQQVESWVKVLSAGVLVAGAAESTHYLQNHSDCKGASHWLAGSNLPVVY